MLPHSEWIICEHCDSLYRRRPLARGEQAYCIRCGALLAKGGGLSLEHLLALSLTAGIVFVCANLSPLIYVGYKGLSNQTSLWQSVLALAQGQITPLALLAGLAVIVAPGLQIGLLIWVLTFARLGHPAPGFRLCLRTLEWLRPWSMLEVCLLGMLVAIIKLGGMLEVHPGIGLWATALLAVLVISIAGRDVNHRLWDQVGQMAGPSS